jgi:hypothetical protein
MRCYGERRLTDILSLEPAVGNSLQSGLHEQPVTTAAAE